MRASTLCALALLTAPALAVAAEPGLARPAFLPPDEKILEVLEASPPLAEARAMLGGARAEARELAAGEHETLISTAFDERRIRNDRSYSEWSVQASRGLRLPGKGALDRAAGAAGVKAAENSVEDARHQASLLLVQQWVGWAAAAEARAIDEAELEAYVREADALERRVALQDAALLDLEVARGAEARARAGLAQSQGRERSARADLEARFPTLAPEVAPTLPAPESPTRPLEAWPSIILERSHEIIIARALADRERLLAKRVRQDRLPDPTIGVRTFNERGGDETGVGVFVSIPFSGPRRSAAADRQAAEASAAEARFAMVARDVRATAQSDTIATNSALDAWRAASASRQAAEQAARRTDRAYQLGERDLSERLLVERQAFEARRLELSARADAHRAILKLALDAHELWLNDED